MGVTKLTAGRVGVLAKAFFTTLRACSVFWVLADFPRPPCFIGFLAPFLVPPTISPESSSLVSHTGLGIFSIASIISRSELYPGSSARII